MSGLLLHKDDVFVHVSHREGYEGPMTVEEEGFLAGSPMVCSSSLIRPKDPCCGNYNPEACCATDKTHAEFSGHLEQKHGQHIPVAGWVHGTIEMT